MEMVEKLTAYDPSEDLGSDEPIAIFMAEAFETNDAAYISHALGVVARAKGMMQIASENENEILSAGVPHVCVPFHALLPSSPSSSYID